MYYINYIWLSSSKIKSTCLSILYKIAILPIVGKAFVFHTWTRVIIRNLLRKCNVYFFGYPKIHELPQNDLKHEKKSTPQNCCLKFRIISTIHTYKIKFSLISPTRCSTSGSRHRSRRPGAWCRVRRRRLAFARGLCHSIGINFPVNGSRYGLDWSEVGKLYSGLGSLRLKYLEVRLLWGF